MIQSNKTRPFFLLMIATALVVGVLSHSTLIGNAEREVINFPLPMRYNRPPFSKNDVPTFGHVTPLPGKRTFDFGSREEAYSVALQADNKIVAAGTVAINSDAGSQNWDIAIFRFNPDGSPDTSFDTDGKTNTPILGAFNNWEGAFDVAIQSDGKIVSAGMSSDNLGTATGFIIRYNSDGSLDSSFGGGGIATAAGISGFKKIAIQADGKIVAAIADEFKIARFKHDGSLDTSFGTGGIAMIDFGNQEQYVESIAIQPDGKIVAVGATGTYDGDGNVYLDFALARFNPNGSADGSFDADGKVTTNFGSDYEYAMAVAIQADGRIVATGFAGFGAIARYNVDGSLDTSFDGDGMVETSELPISAIIQSDGKIVISGTCSGTGTGLDFFLARLNTNGSFDTSFDGDGKLSTDLGGSDWAPSIAIQADSKIVAAGYRDEYPSHDVGLARYNTNGSLDGAFDGDGKVTTSFVEINSAANAIVISQLNRAFYVGYSSNGSDSDFAIADDFGQMRITPVGNSDDRANAAALDPSGRIIAAGYSNNGSDTDFALVRYLSNVAVDSSFGSNGRVTTDLGGNDAATAVAVQPDYKIVVAGETIQNGAAVLVLLRYTSSGMPDPSFGTGGRVIIDAIRNPKAIALQPDGKIIAAGNTPHTAPPFGNNFAIARFHPNGSPDTTFDGDGVAVTRIDFDSQIFSVALSPYGRIVAAGFTADIGELSGKFALVRYNADGSLDTSFDSDGKVTTSFGNAGFAAAVTIQHNSKVVVAGQSVAGPNDIDFAIVRYNVNGSLDTTFDTDGKLTTDFFGGEDRASGVAIARDGTIVAAGFASREGMTDFAEARYPGETIRSVPFDFDNDGTAELSVFRPSNGNWYVNRSNLGFTATPWGIATDKIVPADYDGDRWTDIAVFRDGTWYLRNSQFGSDSAIQFGLPGDIPVPADYTGDGRAEICVYRAGTWWTHNLVSGQSSSSQFGLPGDRPVPADYDGDGLADRAVYRNGEWHINRSTQGYAVVQFGLATDKPVPADYDGDGKTDLAVYRDGTWYLLQSSNGFTAFQWGIATDVPVAADYDGDGKTDAAVFRNGTWYLRQSTNGISIQQFGVSGDKPIPSPPGLAD